MVSTTTRSGPASCDDLSYLHCAAKLMEKRARIFPQFATHNALTVSTIIELAGTDRTGFEFQRLHGMVRRSTTRCFRAMTA